LVRNIASYGISHGKYHRVPDESRDSAFEGKGCFEAVRMEAGRDGIRVYDPSRLNFVAKGTTPGLAPS